MPAIKEEITHLRVPDRVRAAEQDREGVAGLEQERERVLDMYQSGLIDRPALVTRTAAIDERLAQLQRHTQVVDVPAIDWSWPARELNDVLLAIFDRIDLDPATFLPATFHWNAPELRS